MSPRSTLAGKDLEHPIHPGELEEAHHRLLDAADHQITAAPQGLEARDDSPEAATVDKIHLGEIQDYAVVAGIDPIHDLPFKVGCR